MMCGFISCAFFPFGNETEKKKMAIQGKGWKSFDGREVEEGQVLVPQRTLREYARSIGAVMENMRIWSTAGVKYLVMFVPVSMDMEDICWKVFYSELNEYLDECLGPGRRGRNIVSLDAMLEKGYQPVGAVSSAESVVMEGILLDEMITELEMKNALYGDVIRLGYRGMDRKGIVVALPVKKSQAYEVYRKCKEEAECWAR